ncbi:MAG: lipoyl(octanoyl) transferase LipB [Actinomycetota bacterium]|nr:lipoyl(octanoyl) transferase LipB [Actinomycetota bacterium]
MTDLLFRRLGRVPYERAWQLQRQLHAARVAGSAPDTVLLLEHPPVYTAGRRTAPDERPDGGDPVVEVDRGGKITWHGPGQLVGYPIVALPVLPGVPGVRDAMVDVVSYVRRLEYALIAVCADVGVPASRVAGRSGVWTADGSRKLAAVGIRVARGVALHGFALNCDADLSAFDRIVPCGISDAGVTSLTLELGRRVGVAEVLDGVERRLAEALHAAPDEPTTRTLQPAGMPA